MTKQALAPAPAQPQAILSRPMTSARFEVSLGAGRTIEFDPQRISDEVAEFIFNYGIRQLLNDAHASEKDSDAKLALSQKKLENLYEGKLGRAPKVSLDPVGREASKLAKARIKSLDEQKLGELRARFSDEEILAKLTLAYRPQAEKMLAEAAKISIDF